MNLNELILIFIVAILVFGPKQLPMVAKHLAKFINEINQFKQQVITRWETETQQQQLIANEQKASLADALYQKPD